MRFSASIMLAATAGLAALTAAAAQDAPPPAEAAEAAPTKGLSDLSGTVEGLQDQAAPQPAPEQAPPGPSAPAPAPAEPPGAAPAQTPTPSPAPAGPRYVPPLTRAQLDQLAAASARGRLLGAIAAAGQIATRDMLSRVSNPEAAGIAGWIAEPEGNGVTVTFHAEPQGDAPPGVIYRANILGGRVVSRDVFLAPEGRPALNRTQARMAAARAAAAAQPHRPCGADQFNYFVVAPAGPGAPIDVYQISPQTARGRYPGGGHFKTIVAADGSIAETRGYANACADLEAPELPAGQRPAPLAIVHLLDPLPTEIHAFLSVWTGRPLIVAAGDPQRLFGVSPGGMGELPREGTAGR